MGRRIVTGKVILKNAHIWYPTDIYGKRKYIADFIISKDDKETIDKINKAIDDVIEEAYREGRIRTKERDFYRMPFYQQFDEIEGYKDYFLHTTSNTAPQIVDKNVQPILQNDECTNNDIVRASLQFYIYIINGNKGVACGLGSIQVIEHRGE